MVAGPWVLLLIAATLGVLLILTLFPKPQVPVGATAISRALAISKEEKQ